MPQVMPADSGHEAFRNQDVRTQSVRWSDNVERIHGLPAGTFDSTFQSYTREIHPEDRDRVLTSIQRALSEGVPHDVEYRIVGPDGTIYIGAMDGTLYAIDGASGVARWSAIAGVGTSASGS